MTEKGTRAIFYYYLCTVFKVVAKQNRPQKSSVSSIISLKKSYIHKSGV